MQEPRQPREGRADADQAHQHDGDRGEAEGRAVEPDGVGEQRGVGDQRAQAAHAQAEGGEGDDGGQAAQHQRLGQELSYVLTAAGRRQLAAQRRERDHIVTAVAQVLETG